MTTTTTTNTKTPPTPSLLGHSRSLTISNPDPTSPRSPMGHVRSKTIDSPRSTEYSRDDLPDYSLSGRPIRPKIVIPSHSAIAGATGEWDSRGQGDRYPPLRERSKLKPPSAHPSARSAPSRSNTERINASSRQYTPSNTHTQPYSTPEILQTPNDQFAGLDIYDEYHSPTPIPDLVEDEEIPYTAIGEAFTGVSPIRPKQHLPIHRSRSNGAILQRSDTNLSLIHI